MRFSAKIKAEAKITKDRKVIAEEEDENDMKEDIKSNDMGVVFGGELRLPLSNKNIIFGGRYSMGLKNIYSEDG
jgi:hypothetical protein